MALASRSKRFRKSGRSDRCEERTLIGDSPIEPRVGGSIYFSHASYAQQRNNLVGANLSAEHGTRHISGKSLRLPPGAHACQ